MRAKVFREISVSWFLCCLLILISAGGVQAFVIDTFDDTTQSVYVFDPLPPQLGPDTQATATGEAVGDYRTMAIESYTGSNLTFTADSGGTANDLNLSIGASSTGTVSITWDANGNGLGGVDMTEGGISSYITFEVITADFAGSVLTYKVWDTDGNSGERSSTALQAGTTYQIPYSHFIDVDFTLVDKIVMTINGADSNDLIIDFVEGTDYIPGSEIPPAPAIPEPGSLILLGLGGIGLFTFAWIRKKKVHDEKK
jgi:hypothetical protein